MGKRPDNRISYIRKPMAPGSFISIGLSLCGLALFGTGMSLSVRTQGNMPLSGSAICFSGFLFSAFGLGCSLKTLKQKDRNHILAKIGIVISGLLVILCLVIFLIGLKL